MKSLIYALIILLSISITNQATADDKPLSGQAKIDSLLAELPNAKGDTNEVKLLIDISNSFRILFPDKGTKYGLKAVILAKSLNWKKGISASYNSLGSNFLVMSYYPEALEYYQKALKINEEIGNKSGIAINLGNIGIIFKNKSDDDKALEHYKKALKIDKELGNKSGVVRHLGNIGIIYQSQSDYPRALDYFSRSLAITEELADKSGMAKNLGNIAIIYQNQTDYPKALEYYSKSLLISKELGNKIIIANNLGNMGKLYFNLSQDSISINPAELNEYVNLNKEINLINSIEYLLQSVRMFDEIGELKGRSRFLKILADAYKKKGEMEKAFDALEEHHRLKDSVFNQVNINKIAALEKAREDDLKQKEIEKQKIRIAEQEKREKLIFYFLVGLILIMTVVMIVIYRLLKRSDKLLYNVLPVSIAKRLKKKEHPISDYFTQASIVFIDIVDFTEHSKDADPRRVVEALNKIFTKYDAIANKYGLEKIKTIGDSYMAAAGIPEVQKDNTHRAAQMALEVKELMHDYHTADGTKLEVRIGLDCGPVVAGVIGENKFIYDMWSDAVNTASRMESSSIAGEVHVSERFKEAVKEYEEFEYVERGEIEIKGKGKMKTFFIGEKVQHE